jgi:L-rhamnose mutarotase
MEDLRAAGLFPMAATEVNTLWQRDMARFFAGIEGGADENMAPLPEIFHLD